MPLGLERRHNTGQLHFITFSCYHRLPLLEHPNPKDILERIIEKALHSHDLVIRLRPHARTRSPPHQRTQTRSLSSFLRVIKGESSKLLKGSRENFWQARYYDFNTFTTGKFVEKVRYIHRNPVTRGLVARPKTTAGAASTITPTVNPVPSRSNPNGPSIDDHPSHEHTKTHPHSGCPVHAVSSHEWAIAQSAIRSTPPPKQTLGMNTAPSHNRRCLCR